YVYNEKDKRKVIVKHFPALPNHKLQSRDADLNELYQLHKTLHSSSVTSVIVEGYSGSGKTLLAHALAEKLAKEEEGRYYFLPRNMFVGTINAANLDTLLFDVKKFAIAIGCQTKDWLMRVDEGTQFASLSDDKQLHIIVDSVKEKLTENPNWILIIDGLKDYKLLQRLFDEEDKSSWGKGTVIVTSPVKHNSDQINTYCLDKGMDKFEATQLLKELTGLPEDKLEGTEQILNKLKYSPFAIASAGIFINSRLDKDKNYSVEAFSDDLNSGFRKFMEGNQVSNISEPIRSSYVVAALLVKETLESSPHFLHTFDLIGSCSTDWPIPISLISLHLRSPEFHLPPVPRGAPVLPDLPDQGNVESVKPEEEVQESFLSIKRLANNLESFTETVKANYVAIKEMFSPPPLEMSLPSDGVLELMKTCPFITVEKVNPGGIQTIKVNSIVHKVMSQLFNTTTALLLEEQHLVQAEEKHNNSSWFRRLWKFDAQTSLQEYRNCLGEKAAVESTSQGTPHQAVTLDIPTMQHKPSLSCLLKASSNDVDMPSYRLIQSLVASDHYQHHIGLVLKTINGVSSVCSQDVQTRTLARLLMPHLHHILTTSTSRSLGPKSRAHALLAVASINSALGNLDSSVPSLEQALTIEEEQFGASSLEVASTLTRLAEVYSSLDDASKARELLERAFSIYEQQRKKSGEYKNPLEFARTMEALGAVYGALGFKQQSKDYIERALSYMQAAAPTTPDEIEGRRFTCEVASTLADLGHAYLSIGDAFAGRKMLELAVTGLKNMYGDEHPEVVRTLTILGTAYTMQGNWQEGKKMRKEAGKLQSKLDAVVAL
ncbi:hypothetical protein QZH41_017348, partial [Actinostola sp. cb2023]